MPPNAMHCICGKPVHVQLGNLHHVMVCSTISGAKTLCHVILKGSWRRIASRAGLFTCEEPRLGPLHNNRSGGAEDLDPPDAEACAHS